MYPSIQKPTVIYIREPSNMERFLRWVFRNYRKLVPVASFLLITGTLVAFVAADTTPEDQLSINFAELTPELAQAEKTTRPLRPIQQPAKATTTNPKPTGALFTGGARLYIRHFAPLAQRQMRQYGVPASISLAQGLIESRAGASAMAQQINNHFGMKCSAKRCKKGHCANFSDDSHKDFFLCFKRPEDSWARHAQLVTSGRYAKLKRYGKSYRNWAFGLKACGYATDRNYATTLIRVIERYELYKYDH